MAEQNKVKKLHDFLPSIYNTRANPNWNAFIEAIGSSDQETADLIEAIRKQFFIKTASRPYIDRLGAANNVQRPRFVGMDDPSFREFIPVMSYSPKQVKLVLDKLLDLFFMKNSTTAFIQSELSEPFLLQDGWTLELNVDNYNIESIKFNANQFTNISSVSADELVGAINRQAQFSYAIKYEDSISKKTYIRIFTRTIGAKGSLSIKGGLANIALKFDGFNNEAGNGTNAVWDVSIIGDDVTFKHISGDDPGLNYVNLNDIALVNLTNNNGSYVINNIDINNNSFTVKGLMNIAGVYTQTSTNDMKFIFNKTSYVYTQSRRALTWEVKPGEIIVEIPPTPPVVKRFRKGAAHINGVTSLVNNFPSNSSIELENGEDFPDNGQFLIERTEEIKTKFSSTEISSYTFRGRLISDQPIYTYTSKVGDVLQGISPTLPDLASLNITDIVSINRNSDVISVQTVDKHSLKLGEFAIINDVLLLSNANGSWKTIEIVDDYNVRCSSPGLDGSSVSEGNLRVERIGLSNSNSKVILRSSKLEPNKKGPYLWDTKADFVLSSYTSKLISIIKAGNTYRSIAVEENDIPNEEGSLIFGFGTEKQEGPVRYFYKPSSHTIATDPAYIFKFTHDVGSTITKINKRGGIQFKGDGSEIAPYITDPAIAREVLKELMEEVKSVGIFLNFMIRYPELYYGTIDTYRSGKIVE